MDAVTGAFGYSGAAIARELLRRGRAVRTLTSHPRSGSDFDVMPLALDDPATLRAALTGVDTLYNTFWVRFPHGGTTFQTAITGSGNLFRAAADAGVRRIVHVSITHADPQSPYAYFRGKAAVESLLAGSGVPHAIARPAILFGGDGVLINNIAWLMRRFPAMLIGGHGDYRVRGIHIDDLARLMADLGEGSEPATVVDAVGPQSLTFRELLEHLRAAIGARSIIGSVPGAVFPAITGALGLALRDTLLNREEYLAMAAGLADSDEPSTGEIRLTEWITEQRDTLGRRYAHEIRRHFR